MKDRRHLNEVILSYGGIPSTGGQKSGWNVIGIIGTGRNRERVYLEEGFNFEDFKEVELKWVLCIGKRWTAIEGYTIKFNERKVENKGLENGD